MNFSYLKDKNEFKSLYESCKEAEELALNKPSLSVVSARKAMEFVVKFIYAAKIGDPQGQTIFEMLQDYRFSDYINDQTVMTTFHFIRKMGNAAAHGDSVYSDEALKVLENLHYLIGEFCILIGLISDYPVYQKPGLKVYQQVEVYSKSEKLVAKETVVEVPAELVAKFSERMGNVQFDTKNKRNEEENKKLYIQACFRESGWPMVQTNNQALPSSVGLNMILDDGDTVDYVLYGRDNKPLAIVEYTETSQNILLGRKKGIEKADMMAVKLGYKPIVYYTNGYMIYIIDQLGYPPRRVFQFHTLEELELLKIRASLRGNINNPVIDDAITNRDYQKEAIKAACKAYSSNRRNSLLVMATGTGKTRVAISLVDVLTKNNWVKNVLFLADRTSLVRQAHKNFNKLLPSVTTSIYSGESQDRDPNARIIFSTYQTMINLINDDTREFSIGRFDLIIIDEAHRSIFKKYNALFHYFDALMLGLTATPKNEENKSTYEVFGLQDGRPDFAYELEDAIADKYLVGFSVLDKTTEAFKRGIHYDELTDEEKMAYEDAFASGDTDVIKDFSGSVVTATEIKNSTYINLGTIDAMLNDLMRNGQKIEGNDKIGKTIIFADNHIAAEQIVNRFHKLYSHLGLDFCKLIDCHIPNSQNIIDNFVERNKNPQIAVSVDMLDTGIDVPDILNLVFFKKVSSKIKFLQMIGRGTRLSEDIFGPGLHKKGFLVFDYYDNFEYFRTRSTWSVIDTENDSYNEWKHMISTPQSILINEKRLGIYQNLCNQSMFKPFEQEYRVNLKNYFLNHLRNLSNDDIEVQYNMSYVSKYRTEEVWDNLSASDIDTITKHVLPLLHPEQGSVKVKNFDLMMLLIEEQVPRRMEKGKNISSIKHGFGNVNNKIDQMLDELKKLKNIPDIQKRMDLIEKVYHGNFLYANFSLERCETVRNELRDLMAYIPDEQKYHIISAKDFVIDLSDEKSEPTKEKPYCDKVEEYLRGNDAIIDKIRNLEELTESEKDELNKTFTKVLGDSADYASLVGNTPLLLYIRTRIGISDEVISKKFGSFLNERTLTDDQLTYMNQIIDYARNNGDIETLDLQRVSPFCDVDIVALFGQNLQYVKKLIDGLHRPIIM